MAFPKIHSCLICEAVRGEEGGKLTLLGFLGMSPNVSFKVKTLAGALSLTFVLLGEKGDGHHEIAFELLGDDNRRIGQPMTPFPLDLEPDKPTNIVLTVVTPLPHFGRFHVRLYVDSRVHFEGGSFEVAQQPA